MSLNSSLANRVRRLEDARNQVAKSEEMVDWKKVDIAKLLHQARQFHDAMTPEQAAAWSHRKLEEARALVAAAADLPEPERGTWTELNLRSARGWIRAHECRQARRAAA